MTTTDNPNDPRLGYGADDEPGPQNEVYLVLSEEERAKGYIRPVRRSYIHLVCNTVTTMKQEIAETFARNPRFYSATFCVHCKMHKPVAEFNWVEDNTQVGS